MHAEPTAPPNHRFFRFSLRTLFVVAIITGLVISHVGTSWRLHRATQSNVDLVGQNHALRRELGYFEIEDPSKVYVLNLPTLEAYTWRWRMHVPNDHELNVHYAFNEIPEKGLPKPDGSSGLWAEGEVLLTVIIRKDHEGKWALSVGTKNSSTRTGISPDQIKWITDSGGHGSQTGGTGKEPATVSPGEELVLLRLRAHEKQPDGSSKSVSGDADGIMLWIRAKPRTPSGTKTG